MRYAVFSMILVLALSTVAFAGSDAKKKKLGMMKDELINERIDIIEKSDSSWEFMNESGTKIKFYGRKKTLWACNGYVGVTTEELAKLKHKCHPWRRMATVTFEMQGLGDDNPDKEPGIKPDLRENRKEKKFDK